MRPAATDWPLLLLVAAAACAGEFGGVGPDPSGTGGPGLPGDGAGGPGLPDDGAGTGGDGPTGGGGEPDVCARDGEIAPDPGQIAPPVFTTARGFFDAPFDLEIRSENPNATIVYTLDGSAPTAEHGEPAPSPARLRIESTATVRAVALVEGLAPSRAVTHTYLFLADVLRQPARPAAVPDLWLDVGEGDDLPLDAEMDPDVVDDPAYAGEMLAAMRAIPSVSIVMDPADLFGPDGWYANGGGQGGQNGDFERAGSVEVLWPDHPDREVQVDAGVRGHSWVVLKRSVRLSFRSELGAGKLHTCLLQRAPQNGQSATSRFNRLILRAGVNRAWTNYWNPDDTTYTRDQWVRDSQIALSGAGSHGTFVHLYLDGLYWGVYNAVERPDEHFAAEYLGGQDDAWHARNHGGAIDGDASRWDRLVEGLAWQDARDPEVWREIQELLDLDAFSDYLLLNWYAGTDDWPGNNWYATVRNDPPGAVRFWTWDAEDVWDSEASSGPYDGPGGRGNDGAWIHPAFRGGGDTGPPASRLWAALRRSPEFLVRFADRAYRACGPGGALSEAASQARWMALAEAIEVAILGESARWGDAREPLGEPARTRDESWWPEVLRVRDQSMPANPARMIAALREEGVYPSIDPPAIRPSGGGAVASEMDVAFDNPNGSGEIWYTADGSDPRGEGDGAPSGSALRWEGTAVVPAGSAIRARVLDGGEWSALAEATAD